MESYKDLERISDLKQGLNKYLDILFLCKSRGKPLIKSAGDSKLGEIINPSDYRTKNQKDLERQKGKIMKLMERNVKSLHLNLENFSVEIVISCEEISVCLVVL